MSDDDYALPMSDLVSRKIINLRRARQQTQADFGRLFGVSQGSVSRWEKGSTPEPEHLTKLAEMTGETVAEFMGLRSISGFVGVGEMITVKGAIAAGVFREAWQWPEDEQYQFTAMTTVSSARAPHRFGLLVEGDSMNLRFPHGTLLDCVSVYVLAKEPVSGQRVIVERLSHDGQVEATVKKLVIADDGRRWLAAESSNPAFQAPILIDADDSVAETRIIALVVGSYQPE